ncbi:hypothetical protein PGB34_16010 [Xenophilus arseniciresistens]|uniref:MlaB-like STAS domain-containing protein n=1 Tax=Xenophilus arseniciresistens TaxID=1283306 RepID=A0AAE3NDZ4_9BURK|nr:hypothetical protein [Xenophilus arseniciresistens]MDA7417869.1 hypothetical protein [Xenophilus arseniciresistens]
MPKEEGGGRLLSKVAKFVRNPLKDWSELDTAQRSGQPSPVDSDGYSREALKELIERRQRNEFVRRREFDMLRKMRQREAAGARDGTGVSSSFHLNTAGKTDGRALTLKKIDEIEEQMSQQWWKVRPSAPADSVPAESLAEQHARAYADTAPGEVSFEGAADESASAVLPPWRLKFENPLQEASLRFAEGRPADAERLLQGAVAPDGPHADDDDGWRVLLDFYRAIGDAEKFAAASMRYAQRFRRPGPEWVSLRALVRHEATPAAAEARIDWYCPAQLGREGLLSLTQALQRAGPVWGLDWRALQRIEPNAVAPLVTLLTHWADLPTQLRFSGAERLIAVLDQATPLSVRETDPAWWQAAMALRRLMHQADEFELVALNYCITYETLPPAWQEPAGHYASVEGPAGARAGGLALSAAAGEAPADAARGAELSGELAGDGLALWERLDAELAEAESAQVSCAALLRLDLAATAGLLAWLETRNARGQTVELVDVHRLLAVFFAMVGVCDLARVLPRR